jgi:secretion/DNA translocation related CpaE-like protein
MSGVGASPAGVTGSGIHSPIEWPRRGRGGIDRGAMVPVLLLTRDDAVRAAVLRLAALAGTPVHLEAPGAGARALWRSAGIVVVGPDGAGDTGLPRRDGVVVVAHHTPDDATWQRAVEVGAEEVLVLPQAESRLVDLLAAAGEPTSARGAVIGVVGGCGGAGASTMSAALGLTAARTGSAILIDADPVGGGLDVLMGAEHLPGARWPDLVGTRGRLPAPTLLEAVPHIGGLAVLSWDRGEAVPLPTAAAASVLDAAVRGVATVVLDLPRHLDAATEILLAGCDDVVLVVPATVRATAAAARVAARVSAVVGAAGLVVREAGTPRLAPGDVAAALGLDLRASVPYDSGIATAAAQGRLPLSRPRGALHDCCRTLLATLGVDPVSA